MDTIIIVIMLLRLSVPTRRRGTSILLHPGKLHYFTSSFIASSPNHLVRYSYAIFSGLLPKRSLLIKVCVWDMLFIYLL